MMPWVSVKQRVLESVSSLEEEFDGFDLDVDMFAVVKKSSNYLGKSQCAENDSPLYVSSDLPLFPFKSNTR